MAAKKKKWTRRRHKWIRNLAALVLTPYIKQKYHITIEPVKDKNRQYLILMNHQTAFDQFFLGLAFPGAIYYIASEDLFSNGFISKLLRWAVAPIPIKKQTTDVRAVMNCLRVAKEGGTIALAPEGNRTYSGKTEYIKPSILPLIRKLNLPVALFRIEGGYGVQPRWSDQVRKGTMKGSVARIIEPEEAAQMTDRELLDAIVKELTVNEATVSGEFLHPNQAEYLERAMYVCPHCGLTVFESHKDQIVCQKCGQTVQYLPTKELRGIDRPFPFSFVEPWYAYQCDFVRHLDLALYLEQPMYQDTVDLSRVILYQTKKPIAKQIPLTLFGDRLTIDKTVYSFDEIEAITVLGRNKMNLYINDGVLQIKGDKRFNALKYVNIYYHYKNIEGGNPDGEFLGL